MASNLCTTIICLLLVAPTFSSAKHLHYHHLSPLSTTNSPKLQAEQLIRSLNLFPKDAINVHSNDGPLPEIVEKPFRLPLLAGTGTSVEEFGHHAGYYTLPHSHAARMFYLFFESRTNKNDPVVIWLTGGPGCGSEVALFYENGPFKITSDMSLTWNDYGWEKASNLLFVDQPIGTGFSYTSDDRDIRHDENGVSNDLYDFLQAFFKEHPLLAKNDFYITGESYAGHYVPALASRVHQGNKANQGIHINLKGFAIGNGLTNPEIQYKAYPDYAKDMKLIDQSTYNSIRTELLPACDEAVKPCTNNGTGCVAAFQVCNDIFNSIMGEISGTNYYDVRKQCEGNLCYDFSNMETFLNENSVKEALGVGDVEFVSCSSTVYQAMLMDWMRNLEAGIPALIEDGIKVLIYAGEYDLICNWLGNSNWVHAMQWSGNKAFGVAPTLPFMVHGAEAGQMKTHGPLTFLKVHNAGHMVPMDQPEASLQMLTSWMQGKLIMTGLEDRVGLPISN